MPKYDDDSTVFVRNLPLDLWQPELEALFGDIGPVKSASVICHKKSAADGDGGSRGFGFVTFAVPPDAHASVEQMNGTTVRGRSIAVELVSNKKKGAAAAKPAVAKQPNTANEAEKKHNLPESEPSAVVDIISPTPVAAKPSRAAVKARAEMLRGSGANQDDDSGDSSSESEESDGEEGSIGETSDSQKLKSSKAAPSAAVSKKATKTPSKEEIEANEQPAAHRTLRVFGLSRRTTQKQLLKRVQKMAAVEVVEVVATAATIGEGGLQVWPRGSMARVVAASTKDASKVMSKLDRKELHGQTLSVRYEVHVGKRERALLDGEGGAAALQTTTASKAGRVMVRNLNFKATVEDVAEVFEGFGPLSEVHIPTVSMPKHFNKEETKQQSRGFCFVQFLIAQDAAKAVAAAAAEEKAQTTPVAAARTGLDEKGKQKKKKPVPEDNEPEAAVKPLPKRRFLVCGRAVTVALAQSKKDFDAGVPLLASPSTVDAPGGSGSDEEDDEDSESSEEGDEEKDDDSSGSEEEDAGDKASVSNDEESVAGEEDESEDSDDDDDDDDEDSDDDDDTAGASKEQEKLEGEQAQKQKRASSSRDVSEGRSVFVKSLPFEATEVDLRHRFEPFGEVVRALAVVDKTSGLPKGTAFVTFADAHSASMAVAAANKKKQEGGFTVLGRRVECLLAVDRESALEAFGKEGRDLLRAKRDRRNLYLKDEGLVMGVGDAARKAAGRERHKKKPRHGAEDDDSDGDEDGGGGGVGGVAGCPASDLAKRQHAHTEKKKKLANPLFFISPLRLSVRNLARKVDDAELRKVFTEAAKEGLKRGVVGVSDVKAQHDAHASDKAESNAKPSAPKQHVVPAAKAPVRIMACKVMRDLEKGPTAATAGAVAAAAGVVGVQQPSRGYGFVEFATHAHALAALRWANNNPELSEALAQGGEGAAKRHRHDPNEWPRLMVEFACENRGKLQVQEKRREVFTKKEEQRRTLEAAEEFYEQGGGGKSVGVAHGEGKQTKKKKEEKGGKQLSRGQKQRENRRQQKEKQSEEGVTEGKGGEHQPKDKAGKGEQPATKRARPSKDEPSSKRIRGKRQADGNDDGDAEGEEERLLGKRWEEVGSAPAAGDTSTRQQRRKAKKKAKLGGGESKDETSFSAMVRDHQTKLLGDSKAKPSSSASGGGSGGGVGEKGPEPAALAVKFRESASRWFE